MAPKNSDMSETEEDKEGVQERACIDKNIQLIADLIKGLEQKKRL
jgi:hypothetical protein